MPDDATEFNHAKSGASRAARLALVFSIAAATLSFIKFSVADFPRRLPVTRSDGVGAECELLVCPSKAAPTPRDRDMARPCGKALPRRVEILRPVNLSSGPEDLLTNLDENVVESAEAKVQEARGTKTGTGTASSVRPKNG